MNAKLLADPPTATEGISPGNGDRADPRRRTAEGYTTSVHWFNHMCETGKQQLLVDPNQAHLAERAHQGSCLADRVVVPSGRPVPGTSGWDPPFRLYCHSSRFSRESPCLHANREWSSCVEERGGDNVAGSTQSLAMTANHLPLPPRARTPGQDHLTASGPIQRVTRCRRNADRRKRAGRLDCPPWRVHDADIGRDDCCSRTRRAARAPGGNTATRPSPRLRHRRRPSNRAHPGRPRVVRDLCVGADNSVEQARRSPTLHARGSISGTRRRRDSDRRGVFQVAGRHPTVHQSLRATAHRRATALDERGEKRRVSYHARLAWL